MLALIGLHGTTPGVGGCAASTSVLVNNIRKIPRKYILELEIVLIVYLFVIKQLDGITCLDGITLLNRKKW